MPENHQEVMPGELETLKKELETTRQQNLHLQKIISRDVFLFSRASFQDIAKQRAVSVNHCTPRIRYVHKA